MPDSSAARPAVLYRFGRFVLSPARRQLLDAGVDVRLIPRYFDLLQLLVERRHEAVHRQQIFDRVWNDVIVSDGALSQAIRTLRRTLGDDPREPRFIRTVSRHGYQFVYPDVVEEMEDTAAPASVVVEDMAHGPGTTGAAAPPVVNGLDQLVERLLGTADGRRATDEERRDAAEQLHALGTERALERLRGRAGEAEARAILRDARWDVPAAGQVPLLGSPGMPGVVAAVVRIRLRRAARVVSSRWASASAGGAASGALAGVVGGLALLVVPESQATSAVVLALAIVGALAGAIGAAGVGAGLAAAEALARSRRAVALVCCGAGGGAVAGTAGHLLARSLLAGVFGQDLPELGGAVEGIVLGAGAGLGYAAGTGSLPGGGMATPHGVRRLRTALLAGGCCALAGMGLALAGRHLVSSSLDLMAGAFRGSAVGLAPIARLLGEQDLRPITRTLVSAFEGLMFGAGMVLGLTHRPRVLGRDEARG